MVIIIIVTISSIIPIYLFHITCNMNQFYEVVEGSTFTGIAGYNHRIVMNTEIEQSVKNDVAKMFELSNKMLEYKTSTYNNIFFYFFVVQIFLLVIFGLIFLKKTNYKFIGKCLLISGIISIIIFLCMFFIIKMNIVF